MHEALFSIISVNEPDAMVFSAHLQDWAQKRQQAFHHQS